jgi:hypothetical protein
MQGLVLGDKFKMKKRVPARSKRTRKSNNFDFRLDAEKILRTVGDQEAFYFYETVGKPIGEKAGSLSDFLDKVRSVKSESLTFHLQRNDFQNWIEKTLGDDNLAGKLSRISSSDNSEIRMSICKTVENRLKELRESSSGILVDTNSTILLSSH